MEAYDISNTQGFESVGSMVVFEDGKAKNSDYRKFKIKTVIGVAVPYKEHLHQTLLVRPHKRNDVRVFHAHVCHFLFLRNALNGADFIPQGSCLFRNL